MVCLSSYSSTHFPSLCNIDNATSSFGLSPLSFLLVFRLLVFSEPMLLVLPRNKNGNTHKNKIDDEVGPSEHKHKQDARAPWKELGKQRAYSLFHVVLPLCVSVYRIFSPVCVEMFSAHIFTHLVFCRCLFCLFSSVS